MTGILHETAKIGRRTVAHAEPFDSSSAPVVDTDILILGGGLAGLAAGSAFGARAAVLERDTRPGGLVRTEKFGEFWFDHVVHLLYFPDDETQRRVLELAGTFVEPCPPRALIDFVEYTTPFPFQTNLHAVPPGRRFECLRDFTAAALRRDTDSSVPADYRDQLERAFGRAMCDEFFFPYNEKMWRRPLESLATSGFHWNLAQPGIDEVLRGALGPAMKEAYNGRGWYPRPPLAHPVRGMEVLSRELASHVPGLHLAHWVESIDPERREAVVRDDRATRVWRWSDRCLSSLPLPVLMRMCAGAPRDLCEATARLPHNRVRSVALSIEGPRPSERGHWRYYPSRDLSFTRLIHMCEFDAAMAPPWGWSILTEVTESAERPRVRTDDLIRAVCRDVEAARALPSDCRVIDAHVIDVDPAYVVFTPDSQDVVAAATAFLREAGVEPIGRYGRWEYSSMAQVLRDSFAVADAVDAAVSRSIS
jgi:protoporphyrinogen oxidase